MGVKVKIRWGRRSMAQSFSRWNGTFENAKDRRNVREQALAQLKSKSACVYFVNWRERWCQICRLKKTCRKVMCRWLQMQVALFYGIWHELTKDGMMRNSHAARLHRRTHRLIHRCLRTTLLKAWSIWSQSASQCREVVDLFNSVKTRLQRQTLGVCICQWRFKVDWKKRLDIAMQKLASRFSLELRAPFPSKVCLVLDMSMSEIDGREEAFKDAVVRDVADAVAGRSAFIHCEALERGSIVVCLKLEHGVCGKYRDVDDVAKELVAQAILPDSKLKNGRYTCNARDGTVTSLAAATSLARLPAKLAFYVQHRSLSNALLSWHGHVGHKIRTRQTVRLKSASLQRHLLLFCLQRHLLLFCLSSWLVVQRQKGGRTAEGREVSSRRFLSFMIYDT